MLLPCPPYNISVPVLKLLAVVLSSLSSSSIMFTARFCCPSDTCSILTNLFAIAASNGPNVAASRFSPSVVFSPMLLCVLYLLLFLSCSNDPCVFPVLLFPLVAAGGCRQRVGGSSDGPFSFFGGDPPPAAACPLRAITPLLSVSTTLSAKSSVRSFAAGCPPCWRNRQSRNPHRPKTLDQHRNGRPFGCVYCGKVGRSVCLFPAA